MIEHSPKVWLLHPFRCNTLALHLKFEVFVSHVFENDSFGRHWMQRIHWIQSPWTLKNVQASLHKTFDFENGYVWFQNQRIHQPLDLELSRNSNEVPCKDERSSRGTSQSAQRCLRFSAKIRLPAANSEILRDTQSSSQIADTCGLICRLLATSHLEANLRNCL
jgi:hypothetical protein